MTPASMYPYTLFVRAVWRRLTATEVADWTRAVATPEGRASFAEAVTDNLGAEMLAEWTLRNAAARRCYAAEVISLSAIPPDVMHLTCEAVHTAARKELKRRRIKLWPEVRQWAEDKNHESRLWELSGRDLYRYITLREAEIAEAEAGGHHAHP